MKTAYLDYRKKKIFKVDEYCVTLKQQQKKIEIKAKNYECENSKNKEIVSEKFDLDGESICITKRQQY